jgi:hypothetical protein
MEFFSVPRTGRRRLSPPNLIENRRHGRVRREFARRIEGFSSSSRPFPPFSNELDKAKVVKPRCSIIWLLFWRSFWGEVES